MQHVVRFVALGDSLTEGVGDPDPAYPNGWRGWAELVADAFAATDPTAEYVNLALRGRRAGQVLADQVEPALALEPTVITLWAGGNDLLLPRVSVDAVAATLEECLHRLRPGGARVLLFTTFELEPSFVLRPARARATALNDRLRVVAHRQEVELVDVADLGRHGRTFFCADRVHPNPLGHGMIAQRVAGVLRLPGSEWSGSGEHALAGDRWSGEVGWWLGSVVPHVWRWATAAGSREHVDPKWSRPVQPALRLAPGAPGAPGPGTDRTAKAPRTGVSAVRGALHTGGR